MEANTVKAAGEALAAINCIDTRGLKRLLCELVEADIFDGGQINKTISAVEKAKSALSAPLRNCDVGSVEEQTRRMRTHCNRRKPDCKDSLGNRCKCYGDISKENCFLKWAQMPYEGDVK